MIGSHPWIGRTSESMAAAREGEQIKCRQVGFAKEVPMRSFGVIRRRGVRYRNLIFHTIKVSVALYV